MVRFLRISAILAVVGLVMNWLVWELPIWPSWLRTHAVAFLFQSFVFPLYVVLPIFLARNRAPWMFTAIAGGMMMLITVLWLVLPMCGFNLHSALFLAIFCVCECMFWVSLFMAQRRQTTLSRLKGPILSGLVLSSLLIFSSVSSRLLWDALLSGKGGLGACPDFVATAVGAGHGCLYYLFLVAQVAFCLQLFRHVRETGGDPVRSVLSFGGRLRRRHFWLTCPATLPVALCLGPQLVAMLNECHEADNIHLLYIGLKCGVFFALVLVSLALRVRRFHDQNLSGWWVALCTVVELSSIVGPAAAAFVVELAFDCLPGTVGPNRFGPDPLGRDAPAEPPAKITAQPVPTPIEVQPVPKLIAEPLTSPQTRSPVADRLAVPKLIAESLTSPQTRSPVADRLAVLADLRTRGLVTEDEYREKLAEILASL